MFLFSMTDTSTNSLQELQTYATEELRGKGVYAGYRPREDVLREVGELLPRAHMVVISAPWCGDCRREVPKMARILERLPSGWTIELHKDDERAKQEYGVQAIPTFLVKDSPTGRELGRIVESPSGAEGLEGDLRAIAQRTEAAPTSS